MRPFVCFHFSFQGVPFLLFKFVKYRLMVNLTNLVQFLTNLSNMLIRIFSFNYFHYLEKNSPPIFCPPLFSCLMIHVITYFDIFNIKKCSSVRSFSLIVCVCMCVCVCVLIDLGLQVNCSLY